MPSHRVRVSLIENYPKSLNINIEEAVENLSGLMDYPKSSYFLRNLYRVTTKYEKQSESQELVSENITEIISVEIKRG
jgi:hypothetical protein